MHRHTLLLAGVAATSALVAPARLRVPPRATLQSHAAAAHPAMYRVVGESTRFVVSGAVATTLLVRRDAETLTSAAPSGKRYAAPSPKRYARHHAALACVRLGVAFLAPSPARSAEYPRGGRGGLTRHKFFTEQ